MVRHVTAEANITHAFPLSVTAALWLANVLCAKSLTQLTDHQFPSVENSKQSDCSKWYPTSPLSACQALVILLPAKRHPSCKPQDAGSLGAEG